MKIKTWVATAGVALCLSTAATAASLDDAILKKAELGDPKAQVAVGAMYNLGDGVPKDYTIAARWFHKAAEQGDAIGQYFLAGMYYHGKGVPKDMSEAARWYLNAAQQGFPDAQKFIGFLYAEGRGVPLDRVLAYMWWSLAANHGEPSSSALLAQLKNQMTAAQIAEAEQKVQSWRKNSPEN